MLGIVESIGFTQKSHQLCFMGEVRCRNLLIIVLWDSLGESRSTFAQRDLFAKFIGREFMFGFVFVYSVLAAGEVYAVSVVHYLVRLWFLGAAYLLHG